MRPRVTMPRWPAWAMFGAAVAFAWPAFTTPPPGPVQEHYRARGAEAAWQLRIHNSRIDYSGDEGAARITELRPEPRLAGNGRRYETGRLIVDVRYARCNDPASGEGFEHQVTVTADGRTVRGCGGERRRDWDA